MCCSKIKIHLPVQEKSETLGLNPGGEDSLEERLGHPLQKYFLPEIMELEDLVSTDHYDSQRLDVMTHTTRKT